MEASQPDTYTLGLPIITVEQAYELVARGIHRPLDTLIAGQVYDIVNVGRRYHDIFVVLKHTFLTEFKVILLPQRCHENLKKVLDIIDKYHLEYSYLQYICNTKVGEPVLWVNGGGFCQTL